MKYIYFKVRKSTVLLTRLYSSAIVRFNRIGLIQGKMRPALLIYQGEPNNVINTAFTMPSASVESNSNPGQQNSYLVQFVIISSIVATDKMIHSHMHLCNICSTGRVYNQNVCIINGKSPFVARKRSSCERVPQLVKFVKCYSGRRKIHFIPSILKILSQKCYHCVYYTRRHLMSLISHCQHCFCQSLLI